MTTAALPGLPDGMSQVGEDLRVATDENLPETLKESGRCHQVQANLATFEVAAMHGFVTTNRRGTLFRTRQVMSRIEILGQGSFLAEVVVRTSWRRSGGKRGGEEKDGETASEVIPRNRDDATK
jgi:hypothetical protein